MSAILTDVPEVETDTGVEATSNPRQDQIEQIAEENHRRMAEELEAAGQDVSKTDEVTEETTETKVDPQALSETDLVNMRVKTKVDGVEEEHSVADLVKSYQKDSAASRRMEDAARLKAELEARAAALDAREAALLAQPETQPELSPDRDAMIAEAVAALYEGDEAKTKDAFNRLLAERQTATPQAQIDPRSLAAEVRQQIKTEDAMSNFGKNYQDIVADPYLAQIADAYLAKELQDGTDLSEALKNAGESTREWLRQKNGTLAPADDKVVRKTGLDNIPAASARSSRSNEADIETTEQQASSIIAEMRKARGLPT